MFTLGLDFGTNSVRALVVRSSDGAEYGACVVDYSSGAQGVLLDPRDGHLARQYPGDYVHGLTQSVRGALAEAAKAPDFDAGKIVGVGVDTTGSSPLPVDAANRPLALDPKWSADLSAQCWLWKDHTGFREAAKITALAREMRPAIRRQMRRRLFLRVVLVEDLALPERRARRYSRRRIPGSRSPTGSRPSSPASPIRARSSAACARRDTRRCTPKNGAACRTRSSSTALDPRLAPLRDRLYEKAYDASEPAGALSPEWAARLGLKAGIPIAIGEFDVHYGAIGCGVSEGTIVKVIGTSTCDCAVVAADKDVADIPGICGIVKGAILPGFFGIEAGQSAVGDIFKWWVEVVCRGDAALHARLTEEAAGQNPGQAGLIALDWNNGNRTILVDQLLTGLILGQDLYTTRADIYRALIEATAFGARAIIERIEANTACRSSASSAPAASPRRTRC